MNVDSSISRFKEALFDLMDETFENHHGIYTDKGTSLFETLEKVTAEEASARLPDGCYCIAAHVEHVNLYLEVLERYILTGSDEDVDWEDIWHRVRSVTPDQWTASRSRLRDTYRRLKSVTEEIADWEREESFGPLAIVVHTAYHLGAIRQLAAVARSRVRP